MPAYGSFREVSESKFIGREEEFKALKQHLESSIQGEGRLVFIVGEAGIGKSRLAEELIEYAKSKEVMTLVGRCLYQENAEPYLPFIDAFGRYISGRQYAMPGGLGQERQASEDFFAMGLVGIAGSSSTGLGQSSEGESDLVPMGLLPIDDESPTTPSATVRKIDPQQDRTLLFESLSQLVIDITKSQPLLLVLDGLQWADDGTLQLLHYLARNIQNSKVMICGTYRPEELENLRGEVRRKKHGQYDRIPIKKKGHSKSIDKQII
jgi:predicted ATPase